MRASALLAPDSNPTSPGEILKFSLHGQKYWYILLHYPVFLLVHPNG